MNALDYIIAYFGILITMYILLHCYAHISREKNVRLNITKIIFLLVIGVLTLINTYMNYTSSKLFIGMMLLFIANYVVFDDEFKKLFVNATICFILNMCIEILVSCIVMLTSYESLMAFDSNILLKCAFSILIVSINYHITKVSIFYRIANKINKHLKSVKQMDVLLFVILAGTAFVSIETTLNYDSTTFIFNISMFILFIIIGYYSIISQIKVRNLSHKEEALLSFMTKYEKIIDDERINRHEVLNELLTLKSIKNKNSKEFDGILMTMINNRTAHSGDGMNNIYNLPTGLKGIIYYKVYDMKALGITPTVTVDKSTIFPIEQMNNNTYLSLCKIMGILLDNAKEAANISDKKVFIDIYAYKTSIKIEIGNTYKDLLDLNRLGDMNYTTKGKGRGLGLFVVKKLLDSTNTLSLKRSVDNEYFISTITIKGIIKKSKQ